MALRSNGTTSPQFMANRTPVPVVMTFAGHDPTGGAGIQADIEALASMGCHTAPVVTAVTTQDTRDLHDFTPIPPDRVITQARAVLDDMDIAAFKVGMLGSVLNAEAVHTILCDYPDCPVVVDPVLATGAGTALADNDIRDAITDLLLPLSTVLTPNSIEARALAPQADTLDACAQQLLSQGCEFVLITGAHRETPHVINTFYGNMRRLESFQWERLPGTYHGSGCTLAAAIAGLLAQALEPLTAVHEAQEYTWESLRHAYRLGKGQSLPNRLFWVKSREE